MYNFDEIVDRTSTGSMKVELPKMWNSNITKDTLMFWVADMDFACAPEILTALHNRIDRRILGYTIQSEDYYRIVYNWYCVHHHMQFSKEDMLYSPGVIPALKYLISILSAENDGILIQTPAYTQFFSVINDLKRKVITNKLLKKDGNTKIDFEDFEEKVKKSKVFILSNPHNPTGRVWRKDELQKMCNICKKYNTVIISDEIHGELVRQGIEYNPMDVVCPFYREKIITCLSPSKTFNLAGMQDAIILIKDKNLRRRWKQYVEDELGLVFRNVLSMIATEAAYQEGAAWLKEVRGYLDDNFKIVKEYVEKKLPMVRFVIPEGTYFAWLDFRSYCMPDQEIEDKLIRKGGVYLEKGCLFGNDGSGFMRMNVACPRSVLIKGLSGIKRALETEEYVQKKG